MRSGKTDEWRGGKGGRKLAAAGLEHKLVFCDFLSSPALLHRPDVLAVYAKIAELDPGDGHWSFTDTIFVAGTIPEDELREAVSRLQPDEAGEAAEFGISPAIAKKHGSPVLAVWWD